MPLSKARAIISSSVSKPFHIDSQTDQLAGSTFNFSSTRNRSPSSSSGNFTQHQFMDDSSEKNTKGLDNTMKQGFCKIIVRTLLLVLLYYLSSIGLTFYQKWLMHV